MLKKQKQDDKSLHNQIEYQNQKQNFPRLKLESKANGVVALKGRMWW